MFGNTIPTVLHLPASQLFHLAMDLLEQILHRILKNLGSEDKETLSNCALVSRRWNGVAQRYLFKIVVVDGSQPDRNASSFFWFLAVRLPSHVIRELVIRNEEMTTAQVLVPMFSLPCLEILSLSITLLSPLREEWGLEPPASKGSLQTLRLENCVVHPLAGSPMGTILRLIGSFSCIGTLIVQSPVFVNGKTETLSWPPPYPSSWWSNVQVEAFKYIPGRDRHTLEFLSGMRNTIDRSTLQHLVIDVGTNEVPGCLGQTILQEAVTLPLNLTELCVGFGGSEASQIENFVLPEYPCLQDISIKISSHLPGADAVETLEQFHASVFQSFRHLWLSHRQAHHRTIQSIRFLFVITCDTWNEPFSRETIRKAALGINWEYLLKVLSQIHFPKLRGFCVAFATRSSNGKELNILSETGDRVGGTNTMDRIRFRLRFLDWIEVIEV